MRTFTLLGLALLLGSEMCTADNSCTWTYSKDGETIHYDLSQLRRSTDYIGEDVYFRYKMQFCGKTNAGGDCGSNSICAYWKDDGSYHTSFGSFDGTPAPVWSLLDPSNPSAGVSLTYSNGRSQCAGRTERAQINLKCDPNTVPNGFTVSEDWTNCILNIQMPNKYGCPVNDSGSGGGFSTFLILLFVIAGLYIGVGMFYNYKYNEKQGLAACPNVEFWQALPGHCTAGCQWTVEKVKGLTGRSAAAPTYDNI